MKKTTPHILTIAIALTAIISLVSCNNNKFHITGSIVKAKDSLLYFENMGLNGPEVIDSIELSGDGAFNFSGKKHDAPEFYRLRIAGRIINLSVDSTETITIKAEYPTMSSQYEVTGSENCSKIKELSIMQMQLQQRVNTIVTSPDMGVDAVEDSIFNLIEIYKTNVKNNYIFKAPMQAYAYFALFQTVTLGSQSILIFNPRNSEEDIKVFAAVATSWDTYFPKAERGENLHNIAIQGMKDVRIIRAKQNQTVDASKVSTAGIIDISLPDIKGNHKKLSSLKGQVVLLDFHLFAAKDSYKRIMYLRDLYNKYHARGLEIYQVSVDPDEHFWKTQTEALPWICVRDENGLQSNTLINYNIRQIPTFFVIDRNNVLQKRDIQIKNLSKEIESLL